MSFTDLIEAAANQYAAAASAAATAQRDQLIGSLQAQLAAAQAMLSQDATQLAAAQQQLAAQQTKLAAALAADAADVATIAADQKTIADLQAQIAVLQPGKAPAPPAGWVEAFRDDMNGKLGPGWVVTDNNSAANELSLRLAANVVPAADHMSIVARRQTAGGRLFTSGYISTAGRASWQFFRAMVRARCTDMYGLWPAPGWFRFDTAVGELDAAEMIGTVRTVVQSVHQSNVGGGDHSGSDWPMPAGWSMADWHVYEVERQTNGTVIWRIDGQETFRATPAGLSTQMRKPMTWLTGSEFTGPAHLNINLQVGGSMPKAYLGASYDPAKILPGTTTGRLDIDWVQVLTPTGTA